MYTLVNEVTAIDADTRAVPPAQAGVVLGRLALRVRLLLSVPGTGDRQ